jgi:hypothetical protein
LVIEEYDKSKARRYFKFLVIESLASETLPALVLAQRMVRSLLASEKSREQAELDRNETCMGLPIKPFPSACKQQSFPATDFARSCIKSCILKEIISLCLLNVAS